MSTNIHHGYRIVGPDGRAPNLFELTGALRDKLTPLHRAAYVHELVTAATTILDRSTIQLAEDPATDVKPIRGAVYSAARLLSDAHHDIVTNGARHPQYDFTCELSLLPDPQDPDAVYGLLYTDRDDYTAAWRSLPGVAHYGYGDASDYRGGVSEAEWELRRVTWDRVLGWSAPIERGLTWRLVGKYVKLGPADVRDEVTAAVPDLPSRAREVARARVNAFTMHADGVRMRDIDEIVADVGSEADRIAPLLGEVTADLLYREVSVPAGVLPSL